MGEFDGLLNSFTKAAKPIAAQADADASYQKYIDALTGSIATSRASLDAQLRQSLGELGQRRDAASGVIATLPTEANAAYGEALGGFNAAGMQGGAKLSSDVLPQVQGFAQPYQTAFGQNKAGTASMQPLLGLGAMANAQQGEAALRTEHLRGSMDLDSQQRDLQNQLLLRQMDRADRERERATEEDTYAAHRAIDYQYGKKEREENAALQSGYNPAAGVFADSGLTNNDVDLAKKSPEYQRYVALINSGTADHQMIVNHLSRANPKLLQILVAENPGFFQTGVEGKDQKRPNFATSRGVYDEFWSGNPVTNSNRGLGL
jgi:hypothetical protein